MGHKEMGFGAIFDILNKLIPGREERIRNRINAINKEIAILLAGDFNVTASRKYEQLIDELSRLTKALENR